MALSAEPQPSLVGLSTSFAAEARRFAVAWKIQTDLLPLEATFPAPYGERPELLPFVLPAEYRWLNLLPDARDVTRSRFAAAGIHWHGDENGPNRHLLSSQVQRLNALAPLVTRSEDLARWLGSFLPVAEVLPFGAATNSP